MAELTKLGRYQIQRVLGRGAMGVVYEGLDPRLNRRVAIKTILKNAAIDAETAATYSAQFAREAQAAGRLNHPHIVHVHDFAEEGEIAYLVMEFIQGRELRSFFEAKETFSVADTVRIMGELLDALEFAHNAGVIHRDVKPANIMLDAQRRVKLADFGVARIQDSERSAAGTMVGTPAFMSPEQISGGKIDRRTDVFSAGTILYQLLTGEQPFTGAGAWTVAKKIMEDDPPRPSAVVKSVSPAFDGIVSRALAKKPANRYASAREFADAVRGALGAAPAAAAPVSEPAAPPPVPASKAKPAGSTSDAEVEFWKAIQNSTDAAEFEFYLEQFPEGMYAPLARHKIAKLRQAPAVDADATVRLEAEAAEKQLGAEEKSRPQRAAAARTAAATDPEATVAIPRSAPAAVPAEERKKSFAVPALIGIAVLVAGAATFVALNRKPAPEPAAEAPAPVPAAAPKAEVSTADIEKIRKETEERIRREYASKSAAEQAAAAKAATEKAVQEKQAAAKAAAEKQAAARSAAEKAAAERAVAEKLAAAKAAGEKAALEKIAAEKAAAEKAAAEKAAAEKAAAEKAAAEKAAAEKLAAAKAAAGPSQDELLEKFIQRHGRDKVLAKEPPAVTGAMRQGEIVYVNDGSCGAGKIREVTGAFSGWGSIPRARGYRCISLKE